MALTDFLSALFARLSELTAHKSPLDGQFCGKFITILVNYEIPMTITVAEAEWVIFNSKFHIKTQIVVCKKSHLLAFFPFLVFWGVRAKIEAGTGIMHKGASISFQHLLSLKQLSPIRWMTEFPWVFIKYQLSDPVTVGAAGRLLKDVNKNLWLLSDLKAQPNQILKQNFAT